MKLKISLLGLFAAAFLLWAAASVTAQSRQRVRFARGASAATLTGTVRGYAYRDYVVAASAGQTITLELNGKTISPVFTVFRPDGENLEGATQMNDFTGELPGSGDYVVRVGMMRAHARRKNSSATYTLKISIR
jgi:hypothetical protein